MSTVIRISRATSSPSDTASSMVRSEPRVAFTVVSGVATTSVAPGQGGGLSRYWGPWPPTEEHRDRPELGR